MQPNKKNILAIFFGFLIGGVSGLIGVGGGEFRLPILIGLFGFNVTLATATNLLIGVLVSLAAIMRRYSMMVPSAYMVVLIMGATSLVGGYVGVHLQGKIKEHFLRNLLIAFLALIGLHFIFAPFFHFQLHALALTTMVKLILYLVAGFTIGIISGLFGVAGGEFRIPLLMFGFGMPVKIAGTVSSFVALPTQIGGLFKHFKLDHIPKENILIAVYMGLASILGSLTGATLVFIINEKLLEVILGVILLIAAGCLYKKGQE